MKETVLDVLMYLFDNYIEEEIEFSPDQESLKTQLKEAGFGTNQVDKAFEWLEGLVYLKENKPNEEETPENFTNIQSVRLYNHNELSKLNTECRGFLLFLEQAGVLSAPERELVIDRVMALETDDIDLLELKWVVLMVMFNQPEKEATISWMENIVMDDNNANLH